MEHRIEANKGDTIFILLENEEYLEIKIGGGIGITWDDSMGSKTGVTFNPVSKQFKVIEERF